MSRRLDVRSGWHGACVPTALAWRSTWAAPAQKQAELPLTCFAIGTLSARRLGDDAMNRDQLIQRLRARARRGGPAEQVWWNGELVHVSEALARASELVDGEHIQARGDDVVIPRHLDEQTRTAS